MVGATLVQIRQVTKNYELDGKSLEVLKGVSIEIARGEVVSIVGRSGAGKSTLLHIMGGLDLPTSGSVEVAGKRLETMNSAELASFRNISVGFVFQFHHLLPEFSALENVAMPLLIRDMEKKEALSRASSYLELVGLSDRSNHKPGELSGGEQQRVAVARALAPQPELVLADEPTGNLDSTTASDIHDLLWSLSREEGRTFVIVTHNELLAEKADRRVSIEDGRIMV